MSNQELFVRKNQLGETSWGDRKKHIESISEAVENTIVEEYLNHCLLSAAQLEYLKVQAAKDATFSLHVADLEVEHNRHLEFFKQLTDIKSIDEQGWIHIFTVLFKADNEQLALITETEPKTEEQYAAIRRAIDAVALIAGTLVYAEDPTKQVASHVVTA